MNPNSFGYAWWYKSIVPASFDFRPPPTPVRTPLHPGVIEQAAREYEEQRQQLIDNLCSIYNLPREMFG